MILVQVVDTEATCLAKGCCYNAGNKNIPCFYPSYNAVNITQVYVVSRLYCVCFHLLA
jgi:hypothetical protein